MEVTSCLDLYDIFENMEGPVPKKALKLLKDWGLIPREGNYRCPNGHPMKLTSSCNIDGWIWRCTEMFSKNKRKKRGRCDVEVAFRENTFFERSQLSICQILIFALMWLDNIPLECIIRTTRIKDVETAMDWNSLCREVVIFGCIQPANLVIGGKNKTVEIDDYELGKRVYKGRPQLEGQRVFVGVERGSVKCFIVPVPDRSRKTLLPLIKSYIRPGSIIISDGWKAYDDLKDKGYTHYRTNGFVDKQSGQHRNTCLALRWHVKRSIPEFNRRKSFFSGYVQKFIFLHWCKANAFSPFIEFLRLAGELYNPLSENPMIAEIQSIAQEDELEEEHSECESLSSPSADEEEDEQDA